MQLVSIPYLRRANCVRSRMQLWSNTCLVHELDAPFVHPPQKGIRRVTTRIPSREGIACWTHKNLHALEVPPSMQSLVGGCAQRDPLPGIMGETALSPRLCRTACSGQGFPQAPFCPVDGVVQIGTMGNPEHFNSSAVGSLSNQWLLSMFLIVKWHLTHGFI